MAKVPRHVVHAQSRSNFELCAAFQNLFSGWEWCGLVEGEVEFQDIDAGLTEKAKLTALGVLRNNESSDSIFTEPALAGDARDLELCGSLGDIGIEP